MQISEVMKRTGLSRKAVYLYEEKELLSPGKVPVGVVREYREYTEEDVRRLRMIAHLRELDFSLADIEKILNSESVDIVLHNHLKRQQKKLSEMMLTLDKLSETLEHLPPNSDCVCLEQALEKVLPNEVAASLQYKLEEDCSKIHARRVAMLMFEAFLDKPFSTREEWDAWYALLEQIEENITPQVLDDYAQFYGDLTTDQLCEDYALRRRLVCSYPHYGEMEERAKAAELMDELKRLVTDEETFHRWNEFYNKIVKIKGWHGDSMEYINRLSNVYEQYESRFIHMVKHYLEPNMDTTEGRFLKKTIIEKMKGDDMFGMDGLIYFDFYNNTLRRVRYGK